MRTPSAESSADLDGWGLANVGPREHRDLNEIMDDRYGLRSTVITSQLPTEKWHDHLGDSTTADAICDRSHSKLRAELLAEAALGDFGGVSGVGSL